MSSSKREGQKVRLERAAVSSMCGPAWRSGEGLDLVPGHHSAGSTPESGLFAPYMLALTPFVSQPRTKITP